MALEEELHSTFKAFALTGVMADPNPAPVVAAAAQQGPYKKGITQRHFDVLITKKIIVENDSLHVPLKFNDAARTIPAQEGLYAVMSLIGYGADIGERPEISCWEVACAALGIRGNMIEGRGSETFRQSLESQGIFGPSRNTWQDKVRVFNAAGEDRGSITDLKRQYLA